MIKGCWKYYVTVLVMMMAADYMLLSGQATVTYWPNGHKKSEGMYRDSLKTGVWMYWYENGQLADSGMYIPVTPDKVYISGYDPAYGVIDTLGLKIKMGKGFSACTGYWTHYSSDGSLLETGTYLPYGMLMIDYIANAEGETEWRAAGPDPVKTGTWKFYVYYNILDHEQEYVNGTGKGKMVIYYEDGKKYEEGYFDEPHYRREGIWKVYDMNGVCIKEILYDAAGNKIREELKRY